MEIKTIIASDLDKTLTKRNEMDILPIGLNNVFNELGKIGHLLIPHSGKPVQYVEELLKRNSVNNYGIIAENGGTIKKADNDKPEILGTSMESLNKLCNLIGLNEDSINVVDILIKGKLYQVAIEPYNISTLTIFTNPNTVDGRWNFESEIDINYLYNELNSLIKDNQLENYLEVMPPFPDGALQVIRKHSETLEPINKSQIMEAISRMYPYVSSDMVAMFGDGYNDIPAMMVGEIIPITFSNSEEEVIKMVKSKDGHVSEYDAPNGLGVPESLIWLANQGFFKEDKEKAIEIVSNYFPELGK